MPILTLKGLVGRMFGIKPLRVKMEVVPQEGEEVIA
jgi:hypothetical protein